MLYNIEELLWDEWNTEHIKKHAVSVKEIEEACGLIILGKTNNNRLLTIVLFKRSIRSYYVVTARDMSRKERDLINEK